MSTRSVWGKRRVVAIGLALLVLGGLYGTARWLHARRLHSLFDGPCVDSPEEDRHGVYAAAVYDRPVNMTPDGKAGSTAPTPGLLDRSDKERELEREIEGLDPDFRLDATSGATILARVREPTDIRIPWVARFLTVTYPPGDAIFPPNLCCPFIEWNDVHNDLWQVTLSVPDADLTWVFVTGSRRWRVPDDVWTQIKSHAIERWATVRVKGVRRKGWWGRDREKVHRSQVVRFRISKDPADDIIVYRLVDPPFVNRKTPNLCLRDIRRRRPRVFLNPREQYCVNCHAFSSKAGNRGKLSIQVRYKGKEPSKHCIYLSIFDIDRNRGRKTILPFELEMSTFMAWSPDETRLAITVNHRFAPRSGPVIFETQTNGMDCDVAVYDTTDGTGVLLPGASAKENIESYPRWTPDGKSVVFSSATGGKHPVQTQLQLLIVPYNGGRGGEARPVVDASGEPVGKGKSSFYARFSPDGKWLTWTEARYGSLIKASSDIYIMRWTPRGEAKPLACNVDYAADSWYSWSSNSRWIVFVTKRDDGIFARLYMTHIDEEGNASPAVRLPIEDPEQRMNFNIPEFCAAVPPIEERRLFDGVAIRSPEFSVKPKVADDR